jgi:hypothetical protein
LGIGGALRPHFFIIPSHTAPLTHRCRRMEMAVEREEEAAREAATAAAETVAAAREAAATAAAAREAAVTAAAAREAVETVAVEAMEAAADKSLHRPAPPLTYSLSSTSTRSLTLESLSAAALRRRPIDKQETSPTQRTRASMRTLSGCELALPR